MTKKENGVPKQGSERPKKGSSYTSDSTMGAVLGNLRHTSPPIRTDKHDL